MRTLQHSKPRILVTGPERGGIIAWLFTWLAVRRAGGRAVHITAANKAVLPDFDGLIIGGGADISPDLYGQTLHLEKPERNQSLMAWLLALMLYPLLFAIRRLFSTKHYQAVNRERDKLEYALLDKALRQDKPVLGICRGAQLINVYFAGTLHQDISGFYTESPQIWSIHPRKRISINSGSRLRAFLQTDTCKVNALHNQSINKLGNDLSISAREINGIVQAIEMTDKSYLIGVQWHPEYLPQQRRQQRLFLYLVQTALDCARRVDPVEV